MPVRSLSLSLAALFILPLLTLTQGCGVDESTETVQPAFVRGEVVVRYHKDLDSEDEQEVLGRHQLSRIAQFAAIRVDHVAIDDQADVMDKIRQLEQDPDVLYAEPNYIYYPSDLPNDWISKLWGLHNDGTYGTTDADIDAREAWNISTGHSSVVVAVTDTGADWDHPDLEDNIWVNSGEINGNGIDDDGNGYVDDIIGWDFASNDNNPNDDDGHGSHVAGVIGATGNNGKGVVGVNWDVSIMPLRIMGPYGASTTAAMRGIQYAVDNGAQVINASWGGPGSSNAIYDAIAYANDRGVLFVTASGNEGRNSDSMSNYPNNYNLPNIVSVGSTGVNDRMSNFSNYGASTVDLAAPGEGIYSTYRNGGYAWEDGTSMSCPFVAGAAALALSVDPNLDALELKSLLMDTGDPLNDLQGYTVSGRRLNIYTLLSTLDGSSGQPPEEEPPPEEEEPPPSSGNWTWVEYGVSSAHPYANDFSGYAEISQPGATEIRLVFDRFEMEQGYDFVKLVDGHGAEVASYTGQLGQLVTDPVPGDTVTLRLETDYSVTDYGIDLTGYEYR